MIELYDLDSKNYADLRQKMVDCIPRFSKNWTDFNASDPGITIIELLCFVVDTLLYRSNRIPNESWVNFLRLIAGATREEIDERLKALRDNENYIEYSIKFEEKTYILYIDQPFIDYLEYLKRIELGISQTVLEMQCCLLTFLNMPYRAIVADDFHQLAISMTAGEKRLKTASGVKYEKIPEWARVVRTWIDVSESQILIILILGESFTYSVKEKDTIPVWAVYERIREKDARSQKQYKELVTAYNSYIQPRLIAGTIFEASKPEWTQIYLEVDLCNEPFTNPSSVIDDVQRKITLFLDPVQGGRDGCGWPYNEPLIPDVLADLIEDVEGVAYVSSVRVNESMKLNDRVCVGWTTLLGVTPEVEAKGSYFRGLPLLEQLIVNLIGLEEMK